MTNILKIAGACLWFIFGCLITYKAWYMIPKFAEQTEVLNLITILFYVGLAIVWILAMVAVPIYAIIQGYKE